MLIFLFKRNFHSCFLTNTFFFLNLAKVKQCCAFFSSRTWKLKGSARLITRPHMWQLTRTRRLKNACMKQMKLLSFSFFLSYSFHNQSGLLTGTMQELIRDWYVDLVIYEKAPQTSQGRAGHRIFAYREAVSSVAQACRCRLSREQVHGVFPQTCSI